VVTANVPSTMIFPAMSFHAAHGVAVLTGGTGSLSQRLRTFAFDGVDWQQGPIAPTELPGSQAHDTVYDSRREAVVLFGGATITFAGGRPRNETWELSTRASYDAFGHGCATTAGIPALTPVGGAMPEIGRAFELEVAPVPAAVPTLLLLGLDDTQWGGGGLPYDLDALGMPGCGLFVSIDSIEPMTIAGSAARRTLQIPLDRGLLGKQL